MLSKFFICDERSLLQKSIVPLVLISALAILLLLPDFREQLLATAHVMPEDNMLMDYFIAVVWAVVLCATMMFWPVSQQDRRALIWIWMVKTFVTLGFMIYYEAHYISLDAFHYYTFSTKDILDIGKLGFNAGNDNIIALSWLHNRVLPDSYHLLKVSFSMVGLVAVYILYRSYIIFIQRENIRVFYILAFFPSVLFWSSILGKDPIILFGISLYVYGVVGWYRSKKFLCLFLILAGLIVVAVIRSWMGPILLLPLFIFAFSRQDMLKRVVFLVFIIIILVVTTLSFTTKFKIKSFHDVVVTTATIFNNFRNTGGTGSETEYSAKTELSIIVEKSVVKKVELKGVVSMIFFLPKGIFTALFRPLPGEVRNPFGLLAGLENVVLLFLFVLSLWRLRWTKLKNPLVLWSISFILIWASIYSFVSFHNFGGAVRFRLQILPVMLGLFFYLAIGASRPPTSESLQKEKV
jgi:hypothetical protein